mmetsp:Transcript_132321/g.423362  ORF Transcript_132321/g.423362 Transcript_132321/m.423362 type:complete len:223 (+) Transcript_132321:1023-1691(+)
MVRLRGRKRGKPDLCSALRTEAVHPMWQMPTSSLHVEAPRRLERTHPPVGVGPLIGKLALDDHGPVPLAVQGDGLHVAGCGHEPGQGHDLGALPGGQLHVHVHWLLCFHLHRLHALVPGREHIQVAEGLEVAPVVGHVAGEPRKRSHQQRGGGERILVEGVLSTPEEHVANGCVRCHVHAIAHLQVCLSPQAPQHAQGAQVASASHHHTQRHRSHRLTCVQC